MSLKVLLADDSMTAQNMGKKILAESGYDVTTVSNGAAAVKKIAEVRPDVIILDIYMPGYTGLEVCERVRANLDTANLPVLLTVGKMEPYRAEDGAKVRADGVIVKPFEATDLLAVVKKISEKVPQRRRPQEVEADEPMEQITEAAMPHSVEVPSEMASTPAMMLEEFNTAETAAAEFTPTVDWAAPVSAEAPVESAEAHPPSVPWSLDSAPAAEWEAPIPADAAPGVEFTSAPQVGEVPVQQVSGLESGFDAEESANVEVTQDPALASAQEMTDFVTSFGVEKDEVEEIPAEAAAEPGTVIAELPTISTNSEVSWDGWAHAESQPVAAPETPTPGTIDDFEAKVAAAMSGFATEPVVEPSVEAGMSETTLEAPKDDFEARVAAAMSGFATEPVEIPEAETLQPHVNAKEHAAAAEDFEARVAAAMAGFGGVESHQAVSEFHAEPAVVVPECSPEIPAKDDFDARIAQAMAAFEQAPEEKVADLTPEPEVEVRSAAINLNETQVLPQEAIASLEEEMKQALAQQKPEIEPAAQAEPSLVATAFAAPEPESIHPEPEVATFASEPAPMAKEAEIAAVEPEPAPALATPVETLEPVASTRMADAVQRAIERLKPQLIAEIVKELNGE